MFCTNCGNRIDDDAKFCTNCGARVAYPAQPAAGQSVDQTAAPASAADAPVSQDQGAPVNDTYFQENSFDANPAGFQGAYAPSGETAQQVQIPADAAPKPKKKGKGWLVAVIAVLGVAVLGFGGYMIYKNTPKQKALTALELAQTAFDEYDMETAQEQAREALALDPELTEARELDHEAAMRISALMDNYEEAVEVLLEDIERYPEYEEEDMLLITGAYYGEIRNQLDSEDYDQAAEVIAKAETLGIDCSDQKGIIAQHNANVAFYEALDDLAEDLVTAKSADGDTDVKIYNIFHILMDDFDPLQIKIKDGSVDATIPVISNPTSSGERLGIYEVPGLGYYVYLGQYDGDIRQGNGISMAFDYTEGLDRVITCEYAVGEWKEDKPNGACTQYAGAYLSDTEFLYDVLIEGTVVDGIYNGDFSYLFSDEDQKFYGVYENGVIKVLDEVDPNGDPSYVYLYNEDKTEWYYFDDVSKINPKSHDGVYGYAYTEN